ncbi:MAG: sodium:solute symporter, partial [Gemmatimonadaceae bacterium]
FLHGARVFTAYEYLEKRFDAKTRSLTAFLFLISRAMSCGAILAAPAVVFSAIFGWPLAYCVAIMGIPTILYTMLGGVKAVTWADVKQMFLIVGAIVAVIVTILIKLPISPGEALHVAGAVGRLQAFDFSFDLTKTYTFWSGIIGGTFLMLSYFGTDQSQVQRYLTAKSIDEARSSLLISAYWKIPLQACVLLIGVLVFVFYLFQAPPLLFNPVQEGRVRAAAPDSLDQLEARYQSAHATRLAAAQALVAARRSGTNLAAAAADFRSRDSSVTTVRSDALQLVKRITGDAPFAADGKTPRDVNFIIPSFVLNVLPIGLSGIFIAAVMAAAMNAISAELTSLSTATVIDFYRRWFRRESSDEHLLFVSRAAIVFWGIFACVVATFAATLGSLIEVVNRFGSFFYGSILGVFFLAMIPRSKARGAFFGLLAGMGTVGAVAFGAPDVSFLWHNVIGAVAVVVVGLALSLPDGQKPATA